MEIRAKYECPSCQRAVLNRKIDKCLYCGAILPENFLFSKEEIEKLDLQARAMEEQKARNKPLHSSGAGDGFDIGDVIDLASDFGSLLD